MATGVTEGTTQGLALPGDEVEVGGARAFDDNELALVLEPVFELVDALAADVDIVVRVFGNNGTENRLKSRVRLGVRF
jgi:hypothetical protein